MTGGSSGTDGVVRTALLGDGAQVTRCGLRQDELTALTAHAADADRLLIQSCDVSAPDAVDALAKTTPLASAEPPGSSAAPVIAATRLRTGSAASVRGAGKFLADALVTVKAAGAGGADGRGLVIVRADSAYYSGDVVAAARRAGARFSITARANTAITTAIASIGEDA